MRKVISLFLVMLAACGQPASLEPRDWVRYVENEDNGFKRTITTKDYTYIFQYKPAELVALKEAISERGTLKKRIAELSNTVWFNVSIKSNNSQVNPLKNKVSSMGEYNERLNFYLYSAEKYFSFKYAGMETEKVGYFFENNYGLTPMDVMIIGFKIPDKTPTSDMILEFDDQYNDNRLLKVNIAKNDLLKIPSLKL